MVTPARAPTRWSSSHRIIRTIYPPVDLFDDIAPQAEWAALTAAEARTNPRVLDAIGDLGLVPPHRRIEGSGALLMGASLIMGAFTHASRDRPNRFSDGSYGVWYCGDRFEVALAETAHHFARFMAATNQPAADADFRELVCAVHGDLADGAAPELLNPNDWTAGQIFGRAMRQAGADGVLYPSVRYPRGQAMAVFWPDCIEPPVLQARQFRYGWDGTRMHRYLVHGARSWTVMG